MDKKIILWIVLAVIVVAVLIQTMQLSTIGKAVAAGGKAVASAAPSGGMVGGC